MAQRLSSTSMNTNGKSLACTTSLSICTVGSARCMVGGPLLYVGGSVSILPAAKRNLTIHSLLLAGRHRWSFGQSTNEQRGLFGSDQPGPLIAELDPDEIVGARDVHLHDASTRAPEPAEPAPQPTRPDAHAEAHSLPQLGFVDQAYFGNPVAAQPPALERPHHFEFPRMHDEEGRPEPQPHPGVDDDQEQSRPHQDTTAGNRDTDKDDWQCEQYERH